MDLADLQAFIEAAERGTFTAAAAGLFTTQPALSRRIARLEHELGGSLFDRSNRRAPRLSPLGQAVLPFAQHLLAEQDRFTDAAHALASGREGIVKIAMSQPACSYGLATLQQQLDLFLPGVKLQIVESQPGVAVRDAVVSRTAELGLLDPRYLTPNLDSVTFGIVEHVAIGLPQFLGDENSAIEWSELRSRPLALVIGIGDIAYPTSGAALDVIHENGSPGLVFGMARAALGVTILAGLTDSLGLTIRPITVGGLRQSTCMQLAWPRGVVLSVASRVLIESTRSRLLDSEVKILHAGSSGERG
jgi:DNA-binding transcriptional LysR family regulator